jgi:hypothetical protein
MDDALAAQYDRDGYLALEGLLSSAEVATLKEETTRLCVGGHLAVRIRNERFQGFSQELVIWERTSNLRKSPGLRRFI